MLLTPILEARLQQVLEAAATIPGYQSRFWQAGLIAQPGDVQLAPGWQEAFFQLTPISRDQIRQSPGQFLTGVEGIVYRGLTSGSRGQALTYFAGDEWNQARLRARRRSLSWWGIGAETPILNVASRLRPVRPGDQALVGAITPEFIQRLLWLLQERPIVIRGYPSRLCEVAIQLCTQPRPPVLAIICTGELLFEFQRSLLLRVFQAPVINEYGCQESGISGMSCPEAGQLHLDGDRCLYEVIDGQLVTTDLWNQVMPIVRYQCGDRLQLNSVPCTCGRSGLTATLLGRSEDQVQTPRGSRYLGEIAMPPLPSLLSYRVDRDEDQRLTLWIQPDPISPNPLSLDPLKSWVDKTLGTVTAVQVYLEEPGTIQSADSTAGEPTFPCPSGLDLSDPEVDRLSRLWRELTTPSLFADAGLTPAAQSLIQSLQSQPPSQNPAIEVLNLRLLFLSCAALAAQPAQVWNLYQQAIIRLQRLQRMQNLQQHPVWIEQLFPILYLPPALAGQLWQGVRSFASVTIDALTIQHLLVAIEAGWQRAIAQATPMAKTLKPLLCLLLGDLHDFAPGLDPWLLQHWFELLQGQTLAADLELPDEPFAAAWLQTRRQMLRSPATVDLKHLEHLAQTPEQQSRIHLERGYQLLVQGKSLEPQAWQSILQSVSGTEPTFDLTPWMPIVRSLAAPLFQQGERELAYQCLKAVAPPASCLAAFERLSLQVNDKQQVLCDRSR